MNGPGPFNVSTRPAAFTAATSVVWSFEFTALSTMSRDTSIGAPPTIGLSLCMPSLCMLPACAPSVAAISVAANAAARDEVFMALSP